MSAGKKAQVRRVPLDRSPLWKGGRPLLGWLDVELTERCNNDCVHCSVNRPAADAGARGREMTTDEVKRLLESAAALGCLTVRFTGGEPLLRDDFEELYLFARKLGLRVMIFTNGTLVTPRLAALLGRVPPLERIEVSVYGANGPAYEAVARSAGSFEAACRGLALLGANRVPFIIKGALVGPNKRGKREFEDWASGLAGSMGKPDWAMFLDLRSRRDGGRNELIRRQRLAPAEAADITVRQAADGGRELAEFIARTAALHGDRLFLCYMERGRRAVDAYGAFQYCLLLRHPETVYDLKRGSLREAVLDHAPRVGAMTARDPEYLRRCGRCFLRAFCLQCPARSWSEHGTLDTPVDHLCAVAHAQAEALGFLEAGETAWTVMDWEARTSRGGKRRGGTRAENPGCREA